MGLHWRGYRRVHRQVCKRLKRRLRELGCRDLAAYREYLQRDPEEWLRLDGFCRITISRFWRNHAVFELLGTDILPKLAERLRQHGENTLRCWSAGCACGEEAYSLRLLWEMETGQFYPEIALKVTATDTDPGMLQRAQEGLYPGSSLRELPWDWRAKAFVPEGRLYRLQRPFRDNVTLLEQDIRQTVPQGRFQLILCRNQAFTYFDQNGQTTTACRLAASLEPGGVLVLGSHEHLPETVGLHQDSRSPWLYTQS